MDYGRHHLVVLALVEQGAAGNAVRLALPPHLVLARDSGEKCVAEAVLLRAAARERVGGSPRRHLVVQAPRLGNGQGCVRIGLGLVRRGRALVQPGCQLPDGQGICRPAQPQQARGTHACPPGARGRLGTQPGHSSQLFADAQLLGRAVGRGCQLGL
jgi:hypothetical protein